MARPRSRREVYSLDEMMLSPPEVAVLDTSFVVEAIIATKRDHAHCRQFLERLAETGCVCVVSPLLQLELAEAAVREAVRERHPKGDWRNHRRDGRIRRRAGRIMAGVVESWNEHREILGTASVTIDEIADEAGRIMRDFGLGSYDAAHAATAWHFDVYDFVALDKDFALLPQHRARICTVPRLVKSTRRVRGGS